MSLERHSPIPLYYQLSEWIKEQVQTGELTAGDRLPSERELSDDFQISRMTVRQAIGYLVQQGVLEAKQGVGTFVAEPKLAHDMLHLLSFTEEMLPYGGERVHSRVLEQDLCIPPPSVMRELALDPGATAVKIVRLRLLGKTPLLLETTYVPADLCPGLNEIDLAATSLYAVLEQTYGHRLIRSEQTLEAATANEYESDLLAVETGSVMILLEGIAYTERERPVEYFKAIYRGDRFKFRLASQRVHPSTTGDQTRISMILA